MSPTPPAAQSQTRKRYIVILFAVTLAIITYIDRVCISQASGHIERDLALSKEQMGMIFSVFTLAYALFEIPGGWLGDRFGPRSILLKVVTLWSVFTALTGAAWSYGSMLLCRFVFGAGEAGCFPNLTKAFTLWLPHRERVFAQGIMWLSARWGGAFTPSLVYLVLGFVSWRMAFCIFGLLGVFWAVAFALWFRDRPQDHPGVSPSELALIGPPMGGAQEAHGAVPWGRFLRSRTVWLLWLQYFCMSYGWYFYITWLPTYLREARHVDLAKGAFLAGLPLFFGGIGCIFAGSISGKVARRLGSVARTRRLFAMVGLTSAAALLLVSIRFQNPYSAMVAMGLASFANDLAMPGAWGACMDVGGRCAGSLSGSMNMMGNFGGAVGPVAVAFMLRHSNNNWDVVFWVAAAVYIIGALCWTGIDPVTPLDCDDEPGMAVQK